MQVTAASFEFMLLFEIGKGYLVIDVHIFVDEDDKGRHSIVTAQTVEQTVGKKEIFHNFTSLRIIENHIYRTQFMWIC